MARPLRVDVESGWYHVTSRGFERRSIFANVREHEHFLECLRDEDYQTFMALRGDWAKPLLLWSLRRYSGMTLKAIGETVGGMDYTAVAMAVRRFELRTEKEPDLRKRMQVVRVKCEK